MIKIADNERIINIAILATEPLYWGSGKHYFSMILDNYSWNKNQKKYKFRTKYITDKDILKGRLNTNNFDLLLIPGGGVGDGQCVTKGFNYIPGVKKFKKKIQIFVQKGGGFIGICGGAALCTELDRGQGKRPTTFLERQYDKSALGISEIKHFYKDLAFPLLYPKQKRYPEKIGATGYVFSFAPGITKDKSYIHSGGVCVDFVVSKDNPIFADYKNDSVRIRWWGGPALILPKNTNRRINTLVSFPKKDFSKEDKTKIAAWYYTGGLIGLIKSFFESLKLIKKNGGNFSDILLYTYYLAKPWKKSKKKIILDFSEKPSITSEIYPNENKARIILCTSHPEYMIWWDGKIVERPESEKNICLGTGFRNWVDIKPLSKTLREEFTYTWWIVRRMVAWVSKVDDDCLPPIEKADIDKEAKKIIKENILWDKTIVNQMKNI